MFLLRKWLHRLLLLPKLKSDSGSESVFSQIFDSGSERKTKNPAGVDSGYPDPVPPLLDWIWILCLQKKRCWLFAWLIFSQTQTGIGLLVSSWHRIRIGVGFKICKTRLDPDSQKSESAHQWWSMDRNRIGYPVGYWRFFGSGLDLDIYFWKKWNRTGSGYLFDFFNEISLSDARCHKQSWPESFFQTLTWLLFQNFWIRFRQFLKFENLNPVQTPATIIDPTVIYLCFHLRNDCTDSCYCRSGKVTPDPSLFFHKFLTSDPDLKKTRNPARVDFSTSDPVPPLVTRDGADRKFVPAVRTTSAASVHCLHRVRICCTLFCPHPHCTTIAKFYPLTAMAIYTPSPEALWFS